MQVFNFGIASMGMVQALTTLKKKSASSGNALVRSTWCEGHDVGAFIPFSRLAASRNVLIIFDS